MKLRVGLLSFALFVVESLEVDAANHHRALLDNEDRELDDYQVQMVTKPKPSSGRTGGNTRRAKEGKGGGDGKSGDRAGKWKANLALLTTYYESNGDANVPLTYEEESGVMLGRWLRAVQKAWTAGKLPSEKQEALQALGVTADTGSKTKGSRKGGVGGSSRTENSGLSGTAADVGEGSGGNGEAPLVLEERKSHKFAEFAAALEDHKESTGSVEVKRDFETPEGLKLGLWLASHLVKAKRGALEDERLTAMRKLFAKLGFDFDTHAEKIGGGVSKGAGASSQGGRKGGGGGGGGGRGRGGGDK